MAFTGADHVHVDLERRIDRVQASIDGLVSVALFNERDRVQAETTKRIEASIGSLAADLRELRDEFVEDRRSRMNAIRVAIGSGVVSIFAALVVFVLTR